MKKNKISILPLLYLIFGLYFINFKILYIKIPEIVTPINNWIILFGGILFIIAAFRSVAYSKNRILRRALKE